MSVTFHRTGFSSFEIANPEYSDEIAVEKKGALTRSAGGERVYYDKGITVYTLSLSWDNLHSGEKELLQELFDNQAEGQKNSFYYKSHLGKWYRAFFVENKIDFESVFDSVASEGTYLVDGDTWCTTTRDKPVWSAEFELEVISTTTPSVTTTV